MYIASCEPGTDNIVSLVNPVAIAKMEIGKRINSNGVDKFYVNALFDTGTLAYQIGPFEEIEDARNALFDAISVVEKSYVDLMATIGIRAQELAIQKLDKSGEAK